MVKLRLLAFLVARGFAWALDARPFDIRTLRLPITGPALPLEWPRTFTLGSSTKLMIK